MMTWENLLTILKRMEKRNDPRLGDNVTVWDVSEGEYHPADLLETDSEDDVLDKGHLFISMKGSNDET